MGRTEGEACPAELVQRSGAECSVMHCVYILSTESHPEQTYIGYTSDLRARVKKHNEGGSPHTSKYRPWTLAWYCAFPVKRDALSFERYLKSHSGPGLQLPPLLTFVRSAAQGEDQNSLQRAS